MPAPSVVPDNMTELVQRHLDGVADDKALNDLGERRSAWIEELYRRLDDADWAADNARKRLKGNERALVVSDFEREATRIDEVLTELVGPAPEASSDRQQADSDADGSNDHSGAPARVGTADPQLQLGWLPGRIIAFVAGHDAISESSDEVVDRLVAAGAASGVWEPFQSVRLPNGEKAETVSAPIDTVLGWIVSLANSSEEESTGTSVAWMGHAASLAVKLVSQGRMVPQLKKTRRARREGSGQHGETQQGNNNTDGAKQGTGRQGDGAFFAVQWAPTLIDLSELNQLATSLPHSVTALGHRQDGRQSTQAIVADLIDAICRSAASRMDVPAGPPAPKNKSEIAEAVLANLGGTPFPAPNRVGADVSRRLEQWARPVTGALKFSLIIELSPPDDMNAWYLRVLWANSDGALEPVEAGLVNTSNTRRKEIRDQLTRLELLFPPLLRPGAARRGEVILSQDEAWTLMTTTGDVLTAAGFEVRVPKLSRKKPAPSLRMTSDETESVVGAQQLANVRWSAMFGDVELTAEEIKRLASQARPLIQSHGQWVELDQVDLAAAAAALEERDDINRLTGAEMLRHALGLEGTQLAGGMSIAGGGWADDLLKSAAAIPSDLPTTPDGFQGELRTYQADALAWLGFLDAAGLGGCLALDMGLGKTPTMLAHAFLTKDRGPTLVIAPPAVVGNWAAEAKRFVPGARVRVHHGPNRTSDVGIPAMVERADIVITTYGTAVRDIDALEEVQWNKVVLDEAQAIKNPASDTARQLRRFNAHSRIALTGTPIENGLGDLWAILDWANPGLVGSRPAFIAQLSVSAKDRSDAAEGALRALNGILVFRRTKLEPAIAAELPDRIDELDHCAMTPEQVGLYQAVLDNLVAQSTEGDDSPRQKGAVLAAITALKQICNHPVNYQDDDKGLDGRSGKLARVNEIVDTVFAANEKVLIFTHFASWGEKLAKYLSDRTKKPIRCYHGGLSRSARDRLVDSFQESEGAGCMVLSLKAGGTGLNLTAANHVVLYDRWWNPAVEDQARDRVWRIGQEKTVVCHRLVCPGTVDERVEEVVAGKRQVADLVLPKSSSVEDLDVTQIQVALGIDTDLMITDDESDLLLESAAQ